MSLGIPGGPPLSYIPGNAVVVVAVPNQSAEFIYTGAPLLTANLPPAAIAGQSALAWVSDATSRTFGAAPTGGGNIIVPVWCDGTAWYIGGGN